jgi:hypothetical protein
MVEKTILLNNGQMDLADGQPETAMRTSAIVKIPCCSPPVHVDATFSLGAEIGVDKEEGQAIFRKLLTASRVFLRNFEKPTRRLCNRSRLLES